MTGSGRTKDRVVVLGEDVLLSRPMRWGTSGFAQMGSSIVGTLRWMTERRPYDEQVGVSGNPTLPSPPLVGGKRLRFCHFGHTSMY